MFTNSRNSQFQYLYFLAGKCHTADEAYRVLKDQLAERELAIETEEINTLRRKARRWTAENTLKYSPHDIEAEATIKELDLAEKQAKVCFEETQRERDFLRSLLEKLEPYRRYAHLPDHEAMQACQREEWLFELMSRAEDHLLQEGRVPPDQWAAMKLHPDFQTHIMPHVQQIRAGLLQGGAQIRLLRPPAFRQALAPLLPAPEARPALPDYPDLAIPPGLLAAKRIAG